MAYMTLREEVELRWPTVTVKEEIAGKKTTYILFTFPNAHGVLCEGYVERPTDSLDTFDTRGPAFMSKDRPAWRKFVDALPHRGCIQGEEGY